jgi:hypothetical protein
MKTLFMAKGGEREREGEINENITTPISSKNKKEKHFFASTYLKDLKK